MQIRFDNRVAIVTGAGRGLGRDYALQLARRGARVVVNDLGGARDGTGAASRGPALEVVEEIRRAGGEALADFGDVADAAQTGTMVRAALEAWGRVDIVINNAGVLRGRPFSEMMPADFDAAFAVNLRGSLNMVRAVWQVMVAQRYGRILMTTSGIGLYGQPLHANYGAAKMGVLGLAKTLHLEGEPSGIRVNSLAPAATTRMTDDVLPPEAAEAFAARRVTPAALFLVSENAPSNLVLGAGAGGYNAAYVTMTRGVHLAEAEQSPEGVASHLAEILDRTGETTPASCFDQVSALAQVSVPPP